MIRRIAWMLLGILIVIAGMWMTSYAGEVFLPPLRATDSWAYDPMACTILLIGGLQMAFGLLVVWYKGRKPKAKVPPQL